MPSLLAIEKNIEEILAGLDDTLSLAETEDERIQIEAGLSEMLDELAQSEAEKIDTYGAILNRCETEAERLSNIIADLTERKRAITARATRLKQHALDVFEFSGRKRIEGEVYIAKTRVSESVDVGDVDRIPDALCRIVTTRDPDKKLIKEALKAGQNIPTASIVEKTSISIGSK